MSHDESYDNKLELVCVQVQMSKLIHSYCSLNSTNISKLSQKRDKLIFKGLRVEIHPLLTIRSYGPTIEVIIVAVLVWFHQKVKVRFLGLILLNDYSTPFCEQKC